MAHLVAVDQSEPVEVAVFVGRDLQCVLPVSTWVPLGPVDEAHPGTGCSFAARSAPSRNFLVPASKSTTWNRGPREPGSSRLAGSSARIRSICRSGSVGLLAVMLRSPGDDREREGSGK
jgi:hypothetical protein